MSERDERIVCVAIKHKSGYYASLPPPFRHSDVMLAIDSAGIEQGFLTSTGRFVGRGEAYAIAKAASQLLPDDRPGHTPTPGTLYSEDLW